MLPDDRANAARRQALCPRRRRLIGGRFRGVNHGAAAPGILVEGRLTYLCRADRRPGKGAGLRSGPRLISTRSTTRISQGVPSTWHFHARPTTPDCHGTMSATPMPARLIAVLRRFLPPLLLIAALVAAWLGGIGQWLSWGTLARHQLALAAWVQAHPLFAPSLYALIYIVVVALSLPEAAVVTVAGGLLFGTLLGGMLAVVGSSIGAVMLFLAIRHR